MKRIVMTMMTVLMLTVVMAAPMDSVAAGTAAVAPDEVVLFSDTTSADSDAFAGSMPTDTGAWDDGGEEEWVDHDVISNMKEWGFQFDGVAGVLTVLGLLFVVFVLLPALLIGLITYIHHLRQKRKLRRLAELLNAHRPT